MAWAPVRVSTIHKHVQHLIEKGFLDRSHGKGNNIILADMADEPKAESPARATGGARHGAPLSFLRRCRGRRPRCFPRPGPFPWRFPTASIVIGRASSYSGCGGESMTDDAILDGDLAVLQRRGEYRNGDRVVALIDGEEATLKEYRRDPQGVWLIPHNPDLGPKCYSPDRIDIQGVLVGVMRSLLISCALSLLGSHRVFKLH